MKQSKIGGPVLVCLLLIPLVLSAGCAGSSGSSGDSDSESTEDTGITSGTIDGLAFTVTSGTVTQDTADGPITAGATEAAILFDSDLGTLSGTSDDALFRISAVVSDGGSVDALGFGSTADSFANALMGTLDRAGSDFTWAVYWGAGGSAEDGGTISPAVSDADSTVRLLVAFDNGPNPARFTFWRPDHAGTGTLDNCEYFYWDDPGGTADQGNGQRAAIRFKDATISSVTVDADYSAGCG